MTLAREHIPTVTSSSTKPKQRVRTLSSVRYRAAGPFSPVPWWMLNAALSGLAPALGVSGVREWGASTRSEMRWKSYTYVGNAGGLRRIVRLDNVQRVTSVKNSEVSAQVCFLH